MATVNTIEDVWGVAASATILQRLITQSITAEQLQLDTPTQLRQAINLLQGQINRLNNLMGISHDNFQTLYWND